MRRGWLAVIALAVAALMEPVAHATPVTLTTVVGSDSDGPLAAMIQFIPLAGRIEIIVTNTETGTFGKGQAISAFSFSISGIGTPTAFTELSGLLVDSATIGSGGTWTSASGTSFDHTGSALAADHWGFASSPGTITLGAAGSAAPGGNPFDMILPSSGTAGGGKSLSDGHFDPYILGPGTFYLTDSGVTTSTNLAADISGLTVSFGTGPDKTLNTTPSVPTPEPGTVLSLGIGLLSVGFVACRKRAASTK